MLHSSAAYIASLCNSISASSLNHHPADAISQFNNHLSPSEAISFFSLSAHTPSQKNVSYKLEQAKFSSVLDSSSWSGRARAYVDHILTCCCMDFSHSVYQPVLTSSSQQVAVQWWLGINPSSSHDGTQMVCLFCRHIKTSLLMWWRCNNKAQCIEECATHYLSSLLIMNRVAVGVMTNQGRVPLTFWWLTGIEVCQQLLMSQ